MDKRDLNYTFGRLDTVQSRLDVVRSRVDNFDQRIAGMEGDWKEFGSRLQYIEQDIKYNKNNLDDIKQRDEKHSAKIRSLEDKVMSLTAENEALRENFYDMKLGDMKDRLSNVRSNLPQQEYYSPRERPRDDYYQSPPDSYRQDYSPRRQQQPPRYYEQNKLMQQQQYKPWESITDDEKRTGQAKKDYDRIQMHDGNFKPWALRPYAQDKHMQRPRYFIPDKYLRPEERKVSHDSGVYMLVRTHKDGLNEVTLALKEHSNILKQAQGHLKGIATHKNIYLLEGNENWHINQPVGKYGDAWVSQKPESSWETNDSLAVFWFPAHDVALHWLQYDKKMKIANFPNPDGMDVFIVPTRSNPIHDRKYPVFLMTEYPGIRDFVGFRDRLEERTMRALDFVDAHLFAVFARPRTDIHHVRGSWVNPNNALTIHRFKSLNDAKEFYTNPEMAHLRDDLWQSGFCRGRPISVLFMLNEFM